MECQKHIAEHNNLQTVHVLQITYVSSVLYLQIMKDHKYIPNPSKADISFSSSNTQFYESRISIPPI